MFKLNDIAKAAQKHSVARGTKALEGSPAEEKTESPSLEASEDAGQEGDPMHTQALEKVADLHKHLMRMHGRK